MNKLFSKGGGAMEDKLSKALCNTEQGKELLESAKALSTGGRATPHPNTQRPSHTNFQNRKPPFMNATQDKELTETAAFAIAANLAEGCVVRLLKQTHTRDYGNYLKNLVKFPEHENSEDDSHINEYTKKLRDLIQLENDNVPKKNSKGELEPTPEETKALEQLKSEIDKYGVNARWKELKPVWQRIASRQTDTRQRYDSDLEKQLLVIDLLLLLNKLRNYYSHMSKMKEDEAFSTGALKLKGWLEQLYTEASTRLEVRQPASLFKAEGIKQLDKDGNPRKNKNEQDIYHYQFDKKQPYGVVFLFGLLLSKSQVERLIAKLPSLHIPLKHGNPRPLKRREKDLFSHYSLRDGYSLTQLDDDVHGGLLREIVGYLTLPPLESKPGQNELAQWKQKLEQAKKNLKEVSDTPLFRSKDKVRHYLHTTLDTLKLLPELKFWGYWQTKGTDEPSELWQNELKEEGTCGFEHEHRSKEQRHREYGRNTGNDKNRRFVYDMSDGIGQGNVRFSLKVPHDTGEAREGVLRQRDFITLAYYVFNEPDKIPTVLKALYDWLGSYRSSLTNEQFAPELKAHYPQQIQWNLEEKDATTSEEFRVRERLRARLASRIKTRLDRIEELLEEEQDPKFKEKQRLKLGKHQQVHEILHYFIAQLSRRGRSVVTRNEFAHLQQMLLQYKGSTDTKGLNDILRITPDDTHQATAGAAFEFWEHIHHKYTAALVNGGGKHPIMQFCLAKGTMKSKTGEIKATEGVVGLQRLCRDVLWAQKRQLRILSERLPTATLDQIEAYASELQVSVQREKTPSGDEAESKPDRTPDIPKIGLDAAVHNAKKYTVIPAGFIQDAAGEQKVAHHVIGGARNPGKATDEQRKNIARSIREHNTAMTLIPSYYDADALLSPQAKQAALNHSIATLNSEQKKERKELIRTLTDWRTHDKLCLIMIDALAKKAGMPLGNAKEGKNRVDQFAEHRPKIKLTLQDPAKRESNKTVFVQYDNAQQPQRAWLRWSPARLAKALYWRLADNEVIPAEKLPELITDYEIHYFDVIKTMLGFEKRFYQQRATEAQTLKQNNQKEGYVEFRQVLSQAGIKSELHEELRSLRNAALHEGMPQTCLDKLIRVKLPFTDVTLIGKTQLALLKNHDFQRGT